MSESVERPQTCYAGSGDIGLAYQFAGQGQTVASQARASPSAHFRALADSLEARA